MTRRLQTLFSASGNMPANPKYDVPTFTTPLHKFTSGKILLDEKDITKNPVYLEEDLAYCQKMSLIIDDMETIDSDDIDSDDIDSDCITILVYDNADGTLVYENTEAIDDGLFQIIELGGIVNHLRAGSYTMYLSNLEYYNLIEDSFEFRDNATVFSFTVISRAEALREPSPHQFTVKSIGNPLPMLSDYLLLSFVNEQPGISYRNIYCFNDNEVLMWDKNDISPHINSVRMISVHIWQPGHYTCIIDNGLLPITGVEFDILPNGEIHVCEKLDEKSTSYQLVRISEREPSSYRSMQDDINQAGDHTYTLKSIEHYMHQVANRLCSRYSCPNIFDEATLNEGDSLPNTYNSCHAMDLLNLEMTGRRISFSPAAMEKLYKWFSEEYDKGKPWNRVRLHQVAEEIIVNFNKRRQAEFDSHWDNLHSFLTTLEPADLNWNQTPQVCEEVGPYQKAMSSLRGMIGLGKLKDEIDKIFTNVRFNQLREMHGLPCNSSKSHHMLFFGNPGTGKTTVAKHIGKIFHSMGLLSDGDVIVTDRSKMVGRYLGETETKMQELLEEAEGKVLFIDEAYSLFIDDSERSDFGHRVIESLLPKMAEENPNMLIIMAGYEKELDRMVNVNPGLRGRFAHSLHFDDYSAAELLEIAMLEFDRGQYLLDEATRAYFLSTIENAVANKGPLFSNARWVMQYVQNGILPAMAERVMAMKDVCASDFQLILREDIEKSWPKFDPSKSKGQKKRVGFQ